MTVHWPVSRSSTSKASTPDRMNILEGGRKG
jgi:hypothetical protein